MEERLADGACLLSKQNQLVSDVLNMNMLNVITSTSLPIHQHYMLQHCLLTNPSLVQRLAA